MKIKTAHILCVGTELLLGEVVNTNAAYIAQELARLGISVYHTSVVGDNPERLKKAASDALENADLLVLTGGLGPTYDDLTKETIASLLELPMVRDEKILDQIKEFFDSWGRPMPPNNEKQADIPLGALAIPNKTGTAPGVFLDNGKNVVVLLPGPPFEMKPMFADFVFPRLREMSDHILVCHNLHIMGMGESEVEMNLLDLMQNSTNPTLAPYAKEGEMRLRVGALASSEAEGEKMCAEMIEKVKNSPVGKHIYAIDAENIEKLLVKTLKEKGLILSVAESCTGGYLGKRITDVPGSSSVFAGGCVTYSNTAKTELLGVLPQTLEKHTAVSEQTAIEMARGVRARLGTDIAVSVTGEAGPDSATGCEAGTVYVGLSANGAEYATCIHIARHRDREYIRYVAASRAMKEILAFLSKNE